MNSLSMSRFSLDCNCERLFMQLNSRAIPFVLWVEALLVLSIPPTNPTFQTQN